MSATRDLSSAGQSPGAPAQPGAVATHVGWLARLSERPAAWQPAVIVLLSAALYLPILRAGFVYDDFIIVLQNPWIRSFDRVWEAFGSSVSGFTDRSLIPNYYRPLIYVVYALAYRAFGTDPAGYHFLNVAFHALVGVAVWLVARAVLAAGGAERRAEAWVPIAAALLFAAHPIHTEAVDFIGANTELLFALFLLLSFWLYARPGAGAASVALSAACYLASALVKETGLTLPILLVLLDLAVRREPFWSTRHLARLAAFGLVTMLYFALRLNALGGVVPYARHGGLGLVGHVANVFPLFAQYVGKVLVPTGMTIFYPFTPVTSLLAPRCLAGILVAAAFAGAWWWSRRRAPAVNVGLSFFAAPLLPVLYVSGVGESAFADRYLYVPSAGFCLLVALGGSWLWSTRRRALRLGTVGAAIVVLALYGVGTLRRHAVWQDDLALWRDAAAKAPDAFRPLGALGDHHYREERWGDAIQWYEKALGRGGGRDSSILTNLGVAYARQRRFVEARRCFEHALAILPSDPALHYDLALVDASERRYDAAIARLETALRLKPDYEKAARSLRFVRQEKELFAR